MDVEKIEKLLSGLNAALEEAGEVSAAAVLPVMQCQLLLHIYKKLESIESDIASMSADSWNDHHNH